MKNVLILEDNEMHMNMLYKIIKGISAYIKIFEVSDKKSAYEAALENNINLFVVDIIINNDMAGTEFVQQIRNMEKYAFTPVIFVTALYDPKLLAYSHLHCFGYVEKPFSHIQVRKLVLAALKFPETENRVKDIFFKKDGIIYVKRESEIMYLECKNRKVVVHCINDALELPYQSVETMIKQISSDNFIQCSRSCVINRNFIESIDYSNRFIKLRNVDKLISIGSTLKKIFKYNMEH